MRKVIKITLWSIIGVVVVSLIAIFILLCLDFHFTPEAAVHELYRNNTHIHTDEYDFFLHDETTKDETDENGDGSYADGHTVIKRYGFLYKEIEDNVYNPLVAENGDRVGILFSYEGESQTYRFIHWAGYVCPEELLPELDLSEDVATTVVSLKYFSKNIICNGENIELFNHCYFVTDEPIETLVINNTNVYAVNGIVKGDYWNDEKVIVVNTESDIEADKLKAHYENGGIIVVRDCRLSNDVENIVRDASISEQDEKDLATVFCRRKSGTHFRGVVQGNTSDLESEIDAMVEKAKSSQ